MLEMNILRFLMPFQQQQISSLQKGGGGEALFLPQL